MIRPEEPERERWSRVPDYPATLPNMFRKTVHNSPDAVAIICGERRLTYREVDERSAALAKVLLAEGVGKATRVGILLPNSPEWLIAFFAVTRIGALAVLISTMYPRKELEWVLRHADVAVLLTADRYLNHDYLARLEEIAPELAGSLADERLVLPSLPYLRSIYAFGTQSRSWSRDGNAAAMQGPCIISDSLLANAEGAVTPADLSLIMYTSGSTADPKGVVHTHGSTVTRSYRVRGTRMLGSHDKVLIVGPMCWAGRFLSMMLTVDVGATLICPETPRLDDVMDTLVRERPTWVSAQEVLLREMRQHPRVLDGEVDAELSTLLEHRGLHGEVLPPERTSRGLGMTETVGPHSFEIGGVNPPEKPGAYGRAAPDFERRILDPETGGWLGTNQVGELCLRSPHLMAGMYKKERWEVFDPEGFYHTGDLCRIDDEGFIYFIGRNNDMIKTSGANVSPMEVERVLESYPEIQEAGVFALPTEGHDQKVAALVVLRKDAQLSEDELRARMKAELSAFKVPKAFYFREYDQLPRTGSGKLNKRQFRAQLLETEAAQEIVA